MRPALLIAALALVVVAVLFWTQQRNEPFYISGIIEAETIRVGSRVGGRVDAVHVIEGQRVAKGDTLVTLEPYDLQERLAEAEAALAARRAVSEKLRAGYRAEEIEQARARRDRAQAVLDKLVAGMRPLEIQILQDNVDRAQADLVRAESEFDRVRKLREEARAAQQEYDDAVQGLAAARASFAAARDQLALAKEGTRAEEIAEARAQLAEAQSELALLEAGHRAEDIAEAEANAKAAEANVAAIRRQLVELTITAPMDCVVEAVDLEPGDLITANAPVLSLLDPTRLWVRAFVP
jgi:multidrug resistance efflux pump